MDNLTLFIKVNGISTTEIEEDLGLPNRSIQLHRGIPKKYYNQVLELMKKYGFEADPTAEVDSQEGPVKKKIYNEGRVPDWHDGIWRFRDPENGLWKRYKDWCVTKTTEDGKILEKTKKGFEFVTGEALTDKIGQYMICENGCKVYLFGK